MIERRILGRSTGIALLLACCAFQTAEVKPTHPTNPPGMYWTSWVGNSFGGSGGPNGQGCWVQNGTDEIDVTPDGTVIAGVGWDEAGRCAGLYKDGKVNRELLKAEGGNLPDSAWGWGTGNNALAVWGDTIYIANGGKKLLRFHWTPGDIESGKFIDATDLTAEAIGLAAREAILAVIYKDTVELRRTSDRTIISRFTLPDARDVAIAPDGILWVLAGTGVYKFTEKGDKTDISVSGLEKPSAISFDNKGRLIVCDDGPRQQILFFDVSHTPKLVATFGEKGGLESGTPGVLEPKKLFALRGAGTDANGNLYVAMSVASPPHDEKGKVTSTIPNGTPAGNLFLRSFTPDGKLRWQVYSTAFVDTFGFDPDSDGKTVYSRTAIFDLDLNKTAPGSEATIRAFTLDPLKHPDDVRIGNGGTAYFRRLSGRRLLFYIGQYAGGYTIYNFDEPNGQIAHPVDRISGKGEVWAWYLTRGGDIWNGDAPEKNIRRYRFFGWKPDGKPDYRWETPESWPWPEGWAVIRRILYDEKTDTLYLTGYRTGERVETWGVAGATVARYDGWLKGDRKLRWAVPLPRDGNPDKNEGPLTPESVAIAGDYLFAGMVKPTEGKQLIHILRLSDGGYAGAFTPGSVTGEAHGWLDMPYAVQAMRRSNGEYLILAEEDWRGKNLLYRWKPTP